jgi:integrase/recombinase XerD
MKFQPKISAVLEKRYALKDGNHALKIRIIYERISKYYPTFIELSEETFLKQRDCKQLRASKEIGTKEYDYLLNLNKSINLLISEAEDKAKKLQIFSFETFESNYVLSSSNDDEVFSLFELKIKDLISNNRIGTAKTYTNALSSFRAFHKKKNLPATIITPIFLKKYENWMLEKGSGVTTVGFYLRNLRAIINEIIALNKTIKIDYPFGNNKYVIPTKKNIKKALTNEDLKKIFEYHPEAVESKYFHYWLFMYIGNGMNPYDMFNLKFKNIDGEQITFVRQKTVNTNRTESKIQVNYHSKAKEIIKLFGNKESKEMHIFSLFTNQMTAVEKKSVLHGMVKNINKYMRRIGQKLEIEKDITTYVARHSFVTKLITGGASITEVKDMVGHTSIATTEKYVASIEDDRIKQLSNTLLDF